MAAIAIRDVPPESAFKKGIMGCFNTNFNWKANMLQGMNSRCSSTTVKTA